MSRHTNCKAWEINRVNSIGHTRKETKRARQAEIEMMTLIFLEEGGEIQQLPSEHVESKFNPAWRDYATGGYQERHHES